MKVRVPDYYKNFKCIAGKCEDTCCAGWEVDVDEAAYRFYKTVGGELGNRFREVCIPKGDEDGCSFRLADDKRCPFLNEKMLCDIYIQLGEEALCETCTNFPRFINEYGGVREIGLAPSCYSASLIMVNHSEASRLEIYEDDTLKIRPHDIDAEIYMLISDFRNTVFEKLWSKLSIEKILISIIKSAKNLTEHIYHEIYGEDYDEPAIADITPDEYMISYIDDFKDLELINKDWIFFASLCENESDSYEKSRNIFPDFCDMAFRQLLFYYFYRYIMEAVYDGDVLGSVKIGIAAYLCCKRICEGYIKKNAKISREVMADVFHVYSRQLEHSDENFNFFLNEYKTNERYSSDTFIRILEDISG